MPGNDDNDLEHRLREEPVEPDEETTPAEGRWFLNAALAVALLAAVAAVAGVGSVSNGLRDDVLGVLEKARDSSSAVLDSSTGAIRSVVGASVGKVGARRAQGQRSSERLEWRRRRRARAGQRLVHCGASLRGGPGPRQALPERQP